MCHPAGIYVRKNYHKPKLRSNRNYLERNIILKSPQYSIIIILIFRIQTQLFLCSIDTERTHFKCNQYVCCSHSYTSSKLFQYLNSCIKKNHYNLNARTSLQFSCLKFVMTSYAQVFKHILTIKSKDNYRHFKSRI